jgi:hypothetical protein
MAGFGRLVRSTGDHVEKREDVILETIGYIKGVNSLGYDRQEKPVNFAQDAKALAKRIDDVLAADTKVSDRMDPDARTMLQATSVALGKVAQTGSNYGFMRGSQRDAEGAGKREFLAFRKGMDDLAHGIYVEQFARRYSATNPERPLTAKQEHEVARIEWNSNPNIR